MKPHLSDRQKDIRGAIDRIRKTKTCPTCGKKVSGSGNITNGSGAAVGSAGGASSGG